MSEKIGKIEILRALTAVVAVILLAVAPLSGFVYGTTSALTIGGFALISPLEMLLLISGKEGLLQTWLIPGLIVIFVIVFTGRVFCGWICPVGILLEYTRAITDKKPRKGVGARRGNWERYAILLAVLFAALLFNFAVPYLFSPPGTVYRIMLQLVFRGVISADLAVLALFFAVDLLAIRYGRNWCNSICPLGTVISTLSLVNLFKPKVDQNACIDFDFNCLNCEIVCPMRIDVTRADRWSMMECNKCLKCWDQCPVNAVKIKLLD